MMLFHALIENKLRYIKLPNMQKIICEDLDYTKIIDAGKSQTLKDMEAKPDQEGSEVAAPVPQNKIDAGVQ